MLVIGGVTEEWKEIKESTSCVVVPPPPPSHDGGRLARLRARGLRLFDGGAAICGRAVVYHLVLGLSFEAAMGAIGPGGRAD